MTNLYRNCLVAEKNNAGRAAQKGGRLFLPLLLAGIFHAGTGGAQDNRQWATYYGGTGQEFYNSAIALDPSGNLYFGGRTNSTSGVASGGHQNTLGGLQDGFIVKFSTSGNRLWATYYGGSNTDDVMGVETDASGNVYAVGNTSGSPGSIASGGYQNTYGGGTYDALLVKFTSSGSRTWATYYGGSGNDNAYDAAIDASGNIYIYGSTTSISGIATAGSHQNSIGGGQDAMLIMFSSSGSRIWGTYFGGTGSETARKMATDSQGNIYLVGWTTSSSNIASGGYQNSYGGASLGYGDAYLAKFSSSGTLLWSTYFGSSNDEFGRNVAVDAQGNVLLVGRTSSTSGIASGGYQTAYGGGSWDAFLAKFSSSGSLLWSTYYGGTGSDDGVGVDVDASGNIFFVGETGSDAGIALSGYDNTYGGGGNNDAFLATFTGGGTLLCGTYYGSSGIDYGMAVAWQAPDYIYMVGYTGSTTDISSGGGSYQSSNASGGAWDAYLVKFGSCGVLPLEWLSLTAKYEDNNVLLQWSTHNEFRNDYFEIQRSVPDYGLISSPGTIEEHSWETIGRVSGNTASVNRYEYIDRLAALRLQGTVYYRLKQTDFDGNYSYSEIEIVQLKMNSMFEIGGLQCSGGSVIVNFLMPSAGEVSYEIRDIIGKKVHSGRIVKAQAGRNMAHIKTTGELPRGIYSISMRFGETETQYKFVN